jgi:YrbI family 3-deoxy-D-manno-octulosonate 8-phosphate phosphatase
LDELKDVKIIAIIPARGGSKGIHKKNIRCIDGKPLIAYSIDSARGSKYINRIVVTTDDLEIANVARINGAEIIMRPSEISGDSVSSELAILHALESLEKNEGYYPDIITFIQCTSPMTLSEDIDNMLFDFVKKQADSSFSVTLFNHFLWKKDLDSHVVGLNHDMNNRLMRQDRTDQFLENGAIYVMRTEGFKKIKHRFFGNMIFFIMPQERSFEIDTPFDLEIAEFLIKNNKKQAVLDKLPEPVEALVLDFDGVFTDNKVVVFQDGTEAVLCDRSDGLGISRLRSLGIKILVISTEKNPVVNARCEKLEIPCIQVSSEKCVFLKKWLDENNISKDHVVYVGNDINDLECLNYVYCGVVVRNANKSVLQEAKFVLTSDGGNGAIREIAELIEEKINGGKQYNENS